MTGLQAIEQDASRRALRHACAWFGVGLAVAPVLDVADDAGFLTAPSALDARAWALALATIASFVVIASAAAALLARHRAADKTWFFIACVVVLGGYLVRSGLRASGVVALVVLALALVQLRVVQAERRSREAP